MKDNTLMTFRLMNLKTLDTHAKDFLYILNFKKLSETLLQVYRLNMTKYAKNMQSVNSCCHVFYQ